MEERILQLEAELADLREQFQMFAPLQVDLRIDGVVRPVVILAQQEIKLSSPFRIVE